EQAKVAFERSLELCGDTDKQMTALCLGQLAAISSSHYERARQRRSGQEAAMHLGQAWKLYIKTLTLIPEDASPLIATTHENMGTLLVKAYDLESALAHYREALRYHEISHNLLAAARTRANIARALFALGSGLENDAREYALTALEYYTSCVSQHD